MRIRTKRRLPSRLIAFALAGVAIVALSIAGLAALIYAGLRQPEPPVAALATRAELEARLPPAPRGAHLVQSTFRPSQGCGTRCARASRTYTTANRLLTVDESCAAYFDALAAIEASGYQVERADGADDRDACERMLLPEVVSLMQRDDDAHRVRFIFEASLTKHEGRDAIVFAAVEPRANGRARE